jgi:crossover junction endodeoxyribonuclease RusA
MSNHQQETTLRTWTYDLNLAKPLTLNGSRGQHFARARKVKHLRWLSRTGAAAAGIPRCARVAVELHYAPRDRRRRDPFNLIATLKPVEDGLVDAGVIPDDTPAFSEPTVPVIDPPTGQPGRLYVVVRELEPIA